MITDIIQKSMINYISLSKKEVNELYNSLHNTK